MERVILNLLFIATSSGHGSITQHKKTVAESTKTNEVPMPAATSKPFYLSSNGPKERLGGGIIPGDLFFMSVSVGVQGTRLYWSGVVTGVV